MQNKKKKINRNKAKRKKKKKEREKASYTEKVWESIKSIHRIENKRRYYVIK